MDHTVCCRTEAIKLHDVHWAVSTEVKSNPVDGEEALGLLDQRAERILAKQQARSLP